MRRLLLLSALLIAVVAGASTAQAIVPPRDCGFTTVKGKRYNIRADQLRCSTAKPHARRYLSTGRKPSGYRCRNFPSTRKQKFECRRGNRLFLAIKR